MHMSAQPQMSDDPKFQGFMQALTKNVERFTPAELQDYRLYVLTNFEMSERAIYEEAVRAHHGGKMYGGNVILKVLYGHAQAENGEFLNPNRYATLVAYYKPATTNPLDPDYEQTRGRSEYASKLQRVVFDQLKKMGHSMEDLELPVGLKDFTYDLSDFWRTFDVVKTRYASRR